MRGLWVWADLEEVAVLFQLKRHNATVVQARQQHLGACSEHQLGQVKGRFDSVPLPSRT